MNDFTLEMAVRDGTVQVVSVEGACLIIDALLRRIDEEQKRVGAEFETLEKLTAERNAIRDERDALRISSRCYLCQGEVALPVCANCEGPL